MITPTRGLAEALSRGLSGTRFPLFGGKVPNSAILRGLLHVLPFGGVAAAGARKDNKKMIDSPNQASLRDAALFHLAFFALALPLTISLEGHNLGRALIWLAALYNLALPLAARWRRHPQWYVLWTFLLPLSLTLPAADWMLVKRMGTLVFPNDGVPKLANVVPVYFAGMWIMLLWPITLYAAAVKRGWSYLFAGVAALLLFLLWEWAARPLNLWYAQDVNMVAGFALYPLIPEALLAIAALWMWRVTAEAPRWQKIAGALAVTVFYAGALSLFLLWIK